MLPDFDRPGPPRIKERTPPGEWLVLRSYLRNCAESPGKEAAHRENKKARSLDKRDTRFKFTCALG